MSVVCLSLRTELTSSESNDADVVAQFAWIPEMMLLSLLKRDVTIELKYVPVINKADEKDSNLPYFQDSHSTPARTESRDRHPSLGRLITPSFLTPQYTRFWRSEEINRINRVRKRWITLSSFRRFLRGKQCKLSTITVNELMSREERLIKMKKRLRLDWNLSFLLLPVCSSLWRAESPTLSGADGRI